MNELSITVPPDVFNIAPPNTPKNMIQDDASIDIEKIKNEIYENIINPHIKNELKKLLIDEKKWRKINLLFTILKYVCLVSVPILSLASPYFIVVSTHLAFSSGVLASLGLGFERLSKLALNISNAKKDKFNIMLQQINVKSFSLKEVDFKDDKNSDHTFAQTPKKK